MREKFDDLKYIAYDELKKKTSKEFEQFKDRLRTATHQPYYEDFLTKTLENTNGTEQLFESMRQCWHILDVRLLEICIKFISPKSNYKMEKYKEMLKELELQPIAWVAKALEELDIHPDTTTDTYFSPIVEKIDWNPGKHTIRELNNLRKRKYWKLGLTKCLMILYHVSVNCVVAIWLVPSYYVELLCKKFEQFETEGIYFEENNIISIELNNHIFVTIKKVNCFTKFNILICCSYI